MGSSAKRQAAIFPDEQKILQQLGENIRLAMKRRKITQSMIAERTGLSKPTLRNIERGASTVSIGHYLRVLSVLGLSADLAEVARDDELGRKLQDIELLGGDASVSRASGSKAQVAGKVSKPPVTSAAKSEQSSRIQSLMAQAKLRAQQASGEPSSDAGPRAPAVDEVAVRCHLPLPVATACPGAQHPADH